MATATLAALLCCVSLTLADHTASHDLAQSNIAFANKMYQLLTKGNTCTVFSPLALQTTLAAVYSGARGKTAQQLQDALSLNAKHLERMPQGFQEVLTNVKKESRLRLVSGLLVDKSLSVLPDFKDLTETKFLTEVLPLDFSKSPEASINEWIQKKTDGRIKSINESGLLDESVRLVLGSAAHYDGMWRDPPGSPVTGTKESHVNLHYSGRVLVGNFSAKNFYVIQIPYQLTPESSKKGGLKLNLIIPKDSPDGIVKLHEYVKQIDFETLDEELYAMNTQLLVTNLNVERSYSLKGILKDMGIEDVFDEKASDLKGISSKSLLKVDDVIHSASIKMADARDASTESDIEKDKNSNVLLALNVYAFVLQDPKSKAIVLMGSSACNLD